MPKVKIRVQVDSRVRSDLLRLAASSRRSVSHLVTEALGEYLAPRRVWPGVLRHLEDSILEHQSVGRRLAE